MIRGKNVNFHFRCVGRKVDELRALLYLVIHGFLWAASLSSIYIAINYVSLPVIKSCGMIIFILDN